MVGTGLAQGLAVIVVVVPRFIQSERMSQGSTNVGAHCQWPADQEGVLNSTERFECQSVCSTGHSKFFCHPNTSFSLNMYILFAVLHWDDSDLQMMPRVTQ